MHQRRLSGGLDAGAWKVYRIMSSREELEQQVFPYESYSGLYERLDAYAKTNYYPFHMPGHKRADFDFANPYQIDVTEIEGFDNLHHAEEILLTSQEKLKKLYHSIKSYYLINGSTCGILSAIGALTAHGDRVIIARNCHKSVYHAVKIFGLKAVYVYPKLMKCGIQGMIDPQEVECAFKKCQDTSLVVVTSPTYDGIVSDITEIAGIAHKYHAYCVVDEAHGAHFSLSSFFPESAVRKDADIVIQSLHKTLPSFTQTAALHIASKRVESRKVEEMLGIFQSSSPSYLLMAGIDRCIGLLERSGRQLFARYEKRLACFYQVCEKLKYLHVLTEKDYEAYEVPAVDKSKIIIHTGCSSINGPSLYQILLDRYHLQMEMCSAYYVLGMTSIMDTQDGFDRLSQALLEIDADMEYLAEIENERGDQSKIQSAIKSDLAQEFLKKAYAEREKVMEISEASHYNNIEEAVLAESVGKVCAEYIYLYPPGIPMIVPGERISAGLPELLGECRKSGMQIQGMRDKRHEKILIIG